MALMLLLRLLLLFVPQEPQVCVVTPDEGGRLHVVSSCQGCDIVSTRSR
jgi:hypothetical protein